jgi:hypothetical protein
MQTSRLRATLLTAVLRTAAHAAISAAISAAIPAAVVSAALAPPLCAQAVTGVGDDATLPRAGELRIGVGTVWQAANERYGRNTPGRPNGSLEPLGVDFNFDTIGVGQFPLLAPVQNAVRSLAGMPGFTASLGAAFSQVRDNYLTTPVSIELGLTRRIELSVLVPFVTATSNVNFIVNPTGHEPTLGLNPTLSAPAALSADMLFLAQFDTASAQLSRTIVTCTAAPGTPGCTAVNSNPNAARSLVTNANSFASVMAQLYGGRSSSGSPFIPIEGTTAQTAIEAKVAAYRAMFAAFGLNAISATGPIGAQAPLTAADMQNVLSNPAFGINGTGFATTATHGLGDVDFGLKVNVYDSFHGADTLRFSPHGFNLRQSFGGIFRLGTATIPLPSEFGAIGTGDRANAVQGRTFTDLLWGRHFWVSLVGSYTAYMTDQMQVRIPDTPTQVFLASYRQETVQRTLGDVVELQLNPRWTVNDYIAFSGQYYFRRKYSDSYSGKFTVTDLTGASTVLDASVLGLYTDAIEHRLGIGATYSTVALARRGKARIPLDISYFHYETTLGSLGRVPKIAVDQVTVRVYERLFGR